MSEIPDDLARVKAAGRKLQRADKAREKALAALTDAVRAADAAQYRRRAILEASGMPRASFYRLLKGGQS
jgi:hypothetical protein